MKPPPRLLRPRVVPSPWAVAPTFLRDLAMSMRLALTFNPVLFFLAAHVVGAQIVGWGLLIAAWVIARTVCVLWNWVLLPILACAHYRYTSWRLRRRGDTVHAVAAQALPAPARTAHAVQYAQQAHLGQAHPVAPVLALPPARPVEQVVPVLQHDGSIRYEPWAIESA